MTEPRVGFDMRDRNEDSCCQGLASQGQSRQLQYKAAHEACVRSIYGFQRLQQLMQRSVAAKRRREGYRTGSITVGQEVRREAERDRAKAR